MASFTSRLADGWEHALQHTPLAFVPFITALFNTDKIGAIANSDGIHLGVSMSFPISIVDLWGFVSVPNTGVNVYINGPVGSPLLVFVGLPITLVIQAGLAAGYFGSISKIIRSDSYDFVSNVQRYFIPFLLYTVIPVAVLLPFILLGFDGGRGILFSLVILFIPAYIFFAYLFYATPYLVVLHDTDLLSAARASYGLAVKGGPYFSFALGFLGFTLVTSLFATAIVVNLGFFGIILGVITAAPVGLAANITTMQFVDEIDPHSLSEHPEN
jgi:hypothetical protein